MSVLIVNRRSLQVDWFQVPPSPSHHYHIYIYLTALSCYDRLTSLWRRRERFNLGGGRFIPNQKQDGINVHRSVKIRLEAGTAVQGGKYVPKAMWDVEPNWVD